MANEIRHPQAGGNKGNGGIQPDQRNQANPPPSDKDKRDANTGQLVVAPPQAPNPYTPPQAGTTRVNWLDQAEEYLTNKGWQRAGLNGRGQTLWDDPLGGKAKEKMGEERRLPMRRDRPDAQVTIVKQLEVPLRQWVYPTEEALGVQRSRDDAEAKRKVG